MSIKKELYVRESKHADIDDILTIVKEAFGNDKEAELVENLLGDKSARPFLSLLAIEDEKPVGYILFTTVHIDPVDDRFVAQILAPLAVLPEHQNSGIGKKLIDDGLKMLRSLGANLVFVLGHPEYYPRHGFEPAGCQGFEAPYPIPEKHADAWMMLSLKDRDVEKMAGGKVVISEALDRPEYWRE